MSFDIWVELLQELCSLLCSWLSQTAIFEEEVDAEISFRDVRGVGYGEVTYTGEDEVLQCLYAGNAAIGASGIADNKENMRLFKSSLAGGSPQPQLSIILSLFGRGCLDCLERRGCDFSWCCSSHVVNCVEPSCCNDRRKKVTKNAGPLACNTKQETKEECS